MNVALLQEVSTAIAAHPRAFDMSTYFAGAFDSEGSRQEDIVGIYEELTRGCGTTACIAGWTLALKQSPIGPLMLEEMSAGELLEISFDEGSRLFYWWAWPENFRTRYGDALFSGNREGCAQIAVERIAFFIETNGSDERGAP